MIIEGETKMDSCIFCKITKGDISSTKVYEDDLLMAFMDINPNNKGHTLIITKEHHETLNDIPENTLKALIKKTQEVSKAVECATSCHGYNIIMNNKKAAGQMVPHVHFHVVPRFDNDNVARAWKTGKYSEGEIEEYAKSIRKRL